MILMEKIAISMIAENTTVRKVRPMIALTFDDGPGKYTEELLECLEENMLKPRFSCWARMQNDIRNTVKHMEKLGNGTGKSYL